jgi:signal transduction histidine kinase
LSKRVEEIDTHLKSLSILENKTAVELRSHPLKNMLLNIYSPFKASFNEKKIKVIFERIDENIKIVSDYKIFSLVMHHFFDNAVKYSKIEDEISFIFSTKNELIINMHSLKIEDQTKIFEIGVSGNNTDSLAGDGIGMHVIKKGLKVMNMDISIKDSGQLEKHQRFNKNCFIITTII